jgi:hypothetical protein
MCPRSLLALAVALLLTAAGNVHAQRSQEDDARNRKAAGEAYDRGTAAYLGGEYGKAAEWFETANRMSPAAPALMQAIRSHQRAENFVRAADLALRLMQEYGDDPEAADYAQGILGELSNQFLRVDVVCDCQLDLNGTLVEFHSFFLEPDTEHTLSAHFDTGSKELTVSGAAGENKTIEIEAPEPAPVDEPPPPAPVAPLPPPEPKVDDSGKPLSPLVIYIGTGVTGALAVGATIFTFSANSKIDDYEADIDALEECRMGAPTCAEETMLYNTAVDSQTAAKDAETLRNVLWIATGGAAVLTGVAALLLTDWEGDDDVAVNLVPTPTGFAGTVRARW